MNVQVPFFFKYAVDYYNKLPAISTPEGTIITLGTALLLGCMLISKNIILSWWPLQTSSTVVILSCRLGPLIIFIMYMYVKLCSCLVSRIVLLPYSGKFLRDSVFVDRFSFPFHRFNFADACDHVIICTIVLIFHDNPLFVKIMKIGPLENFPAIL